MKNNVKNKRIIFVLELFWPHVGGAETLFGNLCDGLTKRGYDVSVVTTKLRGYKKYEERDGVKIYRVNCTNRYGFTFLSLWKIFKLARNADIIQTTTFNAALPAIIVAKLFRKPCHLTVLEVWGNFWKEVPGFTFFHHLFEKFVMSFNFDKYIAISQFTKKQLCEIYKIDADKVAVVYPGIDHEIFNSDKYNKKQSREILGLSQNTFYYLYFGRPGWARGVEYLLVAVPEIAKKISNAKLILILSRTPEGNYGRLLELIERLGIKNKIILLDPLPLQDLPRYISAADCVVCPSLAEGFGFMVAEACAMRVPVVTTSVGSLPEVASGRVAYVKAKDSDSLARGVCSIKDGIWQDIPQKSFLWGDTISGYEKIWSA